MLSPDPGRKECGWCASINGGLRWLKENEELKRTANAWFRSEARSPSSESRAGGRAKILLELLTAGAKGDRLAWERSVSLLLEQIVLELDRGRP